MKPEDMNFMSYADLRNMANAGGDKSTIGPYEQHAFTREVVAQNPLMAIPAAAAAPIYEGARALGIVNGAYPASMNTLGQDFRGIGDGLAQSFNRLRTNK